MRSWHGTDVIRTAAAALVALAVGVFPGLPGVSAAEVTKSHGLSLVGALKYGPDFEWLDYVNPDAPKGGTVRLHSIGGFDSFNQYIAKGDAISLRLVVEPLMTSTTDEISSEYGLIAESVEVPDDLSYVIYNLRKEARFHDDKPITADDVIFSFNLLREKGRPFYRFYYRNISKLERLGDHRVKFHFTGPPNRELPQITGQLPVLPKHYWEGRDFSKTTLEPPLGSGPYRIGKFEPGRFVEYERVDSYWAKDLPINRGRHNFNVMRIDFFRDQAVALEAFKANVYDYRIESSSKEWAKGYAFPAVKAGLVNKYEITHQRPTGMQAFAFNLRRPKFRDSRVRRAIGYAFDFTWSNKQLFYGQYARTKSYFSNSELAARTLPGADEMAILEPFRGKIPDAVFTEVYEPPKTDGSGKIRRNLRTAVRLLKQAGWKVENNKLINPADGKPLEIEFLLVSPAFERVVAPFIRNLKRLGIEGRIRTVDSSQYINRLRSFDFDMIVSSWPQSESPGNEQRDFWSTDAADRAGSRNLIGVKNPVIDTLIEKIVAARDRKSLVTATRALDRVLLWNHYVVPQWHARFDRIAAWDIFGRPGKTPRYGNDFSSWWVEPAKAASLEDRRRKLRGAK